MPRPNPDGSLPETEKSVGTPICMIACLLVVFELVVVTVIVVMVIVGRCYGHC